MTRPVVVIAGPTASGKSPLALAVAEAFGGTVINADSMQVYRELSVLTARPGPEACAGAPHRLYGVLAAARRCSVALWREMAMAEIAACRNAHGDSYIRVGAFDASTGWETLRLSFLVNRPKVEKGFHLARQEGRNREIRYTITAR